MEDCEHFFLRCSKLINERESLVKEMRKSFSNFDSKSYENKKLAILQKACTNTKLVDVWKHVEEAPELSIRSFSM